MYDLVGGHWGLALRFQKPTLAPVPIAPSGLRELLLQCNACLAAALFHIMMVVDIPSEAISNPQLNAYFDKHLYPTIEK